MDAESDGELPARRDAARRFRLSRSSKVSSGMSAATEYTVQDRYASTMPDSKYRKAIR